MPNSEAKAKNIHHLVKLTIDKNTALAQEDAHTGFDLARKLGNSELIAMFLTDLGNTYFINGNTSESLSFYKQALKVGSGIATPEYPINTLISISNYYRSTGKIDSAYHYLEEASLLLQDASIEAKSNFFQSKGLLNFHQSQFNAAIENAKSKINLKSNPGPSVYSLLFRCYIKLEQYDSAQWALGNGFKAYGHQQDSLQSRSYLAMIINRGDLFMETSNYEKAISNFELGYDMSLKNNFDLLKAYAGFRIGYFFEISGNYPKAIDLYEESIGLYTKFNAEREIARINGRVAWALIYSDNMVLAEQFTHRSLVQMKGISDHVGTAFAWNILGYINSQQKNYNIALQYYDSALQVRKAQDNQAEYYKTLYNIAEAYEQMGKLSEALSMMEVVLKQELENSKNLNNLIYTFNSIGRIYGKVGNKQKSESSYLKAYQLSNDNKLYPQLKTSIKNLLDFYLNEDNGRSVMHYYRELVFVNDTLFAMEQNNKILQVTALRELEINQMEVEQLRTQARIDALDASKKNQALTLSIYLVILLLLILALVVYIAYNRKKSQDKLAEINQQLETKVKERTAQLKLAYEELETYFYKASHDLRGPITSMMGLVKLLKGARDEEERKKINELIEETALKQLNLVNKIQSLNAVLKADINDQEIDLEREIEFILKKSNAKINAKKIQITTDFKVKDFRSTHSLLVIILDNLINNAIDFSNNPNPKISIVSESFNNHLSVSVIDNGEGIQESISNNLYKMFFRGSVKSTGFGLGLYTVKKAAEKLGAVIYFDSEPHKKTEFKITLKRPDLI